MRKRKKKRRKKKDLWEKMKGKKPWWAVGKPGLVRRRKNDGIGSEGTRTGSDDMPPLPLGVYNISGTEGEREREKKKKKREQQTGMGDEPLT